MLYDSTSPVALPARGMNRRHLHIQRRIGLRALAARTAAPLAIPGSRHLQLSAHPRHAILVAMLLDPGVLHRDSFAKYAAAFFTISRSSFALASSRRKRAFSASSSVAERLVGAVSSPAFSVPARARLTQLDKLDSGIPSRFAAWLLPIDSANRTASTLNSPVYCRFGTASFFAISFSVHQKSANNLMYVKPGQVQSLPSPVSFCRATLLA